MNVIRNVKNFEQFCIGLREKWAINASLKIFFKKSLGSIHSQPGKPSTIFSTAYSLYLQRVSFSCVNCKKM